MFFEPTLSAYVSYWVGFCVRYFAIAGGVYWFLHVGFRHRWLAYRIQPAFPGLDEVGHEIRWSLVNAACTGLSTILLYHLIQAGRTRMYFGLEDHGWAYFGFSAVLGILGYDAWFYWQHRLLHTPWLFARVHATHHRVTNPTAFATFAHHPIETFMGNAYFILLATIIPIHPLAIGAVGLYIFAIGIVAHAGYELYPRGFTHHRLFRWFNTSTHHNMHHLHTGCNYSICFNYWDLLMGTNHASYHETFDAITAGVEARRLSTTRPESVVRRPERDSEAAMPCGVGEGALGSSA
jgi:lathosterol oxidase